MHSGTGLTVQPRDAVEHLLSHLDERDIVMPRMRAWSPRPVSQRVVAEHLGTYTAWVQRHEPRARPALPRCWQINAHSEVSWHAAELLERLGAAAH